MPKRSLAVLIALTGLGACSNSDSSTPTTTSAAASTTVASTTVAPSTSAVTTTPAATTTTTTTTVPATTTTVAPTGQPDWKAIVEALGRTRQSIYAKPDPGRVGEVCVGGSPCANALSTQITDMANKGWHVEGATAYTVVDAKLERFDGATLAASVVVTLTVTVLRENGTSNIVDRNGAIVAGIEPGVPVGQNARGLTILARISSNPDVWRIVQEDESKGVPA